MSKQTEKGKGEKKWPEQCKLEADLTSSIMKKKENMWWRLIVHPFYISTDQHLLSTRHYVGHWAFTINNMTVLLLMNSHSRRGGDGFVHNLKTRHNATNSIEIKAACHRRQRRLRLVPSRGSWKPSWKRWHLKWKSKDDFLFICSVH